VYTLAGSGVRLQIFAGMSIFDLKQVIKNETKIPVSEQQLCLDASILNNDQKVHELRPECTSMDPLQLALVRCPATMLDPGHWSCLHLIRVLPTGFDELFEAGHEAAAQSFNYEVTVFEDMSFQVSVPMWVCNGNNWQQSWIGGKQDYRGVIGSDGKGSFCGGGIDGFELTHDGHIMTLRRSS